MSVMLAARLLAAVGLSLCAVFAWQHAAFGMALSGAGTALAVVSIELAWRGACRERDRDVELAQAAVQEWVVREQQRIQGKRSA